MWIFKYWKKVQAVVKANGGHRKYWEFFTFSKYKPFWPIDVCYAGFTQNPMPALEDYFQSQSDQCAAMR